MLDEFLKVIVKLPDNELETLSEAISIYSEIKTERNELTEEQYESLCGICGEIDELQYYRNKMNKKCEIFLDFLKNECDEEFAVNLQVYCEENREEVNTIDQLKLLLKALRGCGY